MTEIIVTRTYRVTIDQDDLDKVSALNYDPADLADACTRAADAGNMSGAMYLVRDDQALNQDDYSIGWVNDFDPEGQEIMSAGYQVEEIDQVMLFDPIASI